MFQLQTDKERDRETLEESEERGVVCVRTIHQSIFPNFRLSALIPDVCTGEQRRKIFVLLLQMII